MNYVFSILSLLMLRLILATGGTDYWTGQSWPEQPISLSLYIHVHSIIFYCLSLDRRRQQPTKFASGLLFIPVWYHSKSVLLYGPIYWSLGSKPMVFLGIHNQHSILRTLYVYILSRMEGVAKHWWGKITQATVPSMVFWKSVKHWLC